MVKYRATESSGPSVLVTPRTMPDTCMRGNEMAIIQPPLFLFDKRCKSCRRLLTVDNFTSNAVARNRIDYNCKECKALIHKCHTYNITPEQYFVMLAAQAGVCAICHRPPTNGRDWHVDHNHETGQVRALLCGRCNTAIGQFRDDPALCRAAADYLEQYR